jgi:hypothetical protein
MVPLAENQNKLINGNDTKLSNGGGGKPKLPKLKNISSYKANVSKNTLEHCLKPCDIYEI